MTTCSVDHLATRPGGPNSIDPGLDEWWLLEMPPSSGSYFLLCRSHPWRCIPSSWHSRSRQQDACLAFSDNIPGTFRFFFTPVAQTDKFPINFLWLRNYATCKYRGFGHFSENIVDCFLFFFHAVGTTCEPSNWTLLSSLPSAVSNYDFIYSALT